MFRSYKTRTPKNDIDLKATSNPYHVIDQKPNFMVDKMYTATRNRLYFLEKAKGI